MCNNGFGGGGCCWIIIIILLLICCCGCGTGGSVPTCEITLDMLAEDARVTTMLVRSCLCKSQSDARNQLKAGAVFLGDEKVADFAAQVCAEQLAGDGILLKKGKKGFCRLVLKA